MAEGKYISGRAVAVKVLRKFESAKKDSSEVLGEFISQTVERGKATDLVFGVIRNRTIIDSLLEKFGDARSDRVKRELFNILRVGVYELVYCPLVEDYAVVNEAVALAGRGTGKKQRGFANAVLRNICRAIESRRVEFTEATERVIPQSRGGGCEFNEAVLPDSQSDPAGYLSAAFSLPGWLVGEWVDEFGFEKALNICFASNRRCGVYLQPNTLKIDAEGLLAKLTQNISGQEDFEVVCDCNMIKATGGGEVSSFAGFDEGLFTVQDPTAAGAVELLEPTAGEVIVDLCSAPGGKTVRMAQLIGDQGQIIATDIDDGRLRRVKENCERLGIGCVEVVSLDMLADKLEGAEVDAVFADVPCSNAGVLARRCEVRHRIKKDFIERLVGKQLELLETAAKLVRKGGRVCYSTCSIMRQENAGVVDMFLAKHDGFEFVVERLTLPCQGGEGEIDFDGGYIAVIRRKL